MVAALLSALTLSAGPAGTSRPIPVELWSHGDDGLSQQLRTAIEGALSISPHFRAATPADPQPHRTAFLEMEKILGRNRLRFHLSLFTGRAERSERMTEVVRTCDQNALNSCAVDAWRQLAKRLQLK